MKTKKLIILFLIIILIDAAAAFLWFYLYSEIEKKQEDLVGIANALAFSGANAKNLKLLKNQMEEEIGSRAKLDEVFLTKKDVVPFIEYLEKTGKDIGVSVDFSSVKIDEIGKEKPRFQFSLKGKFENIYRFIVLLENVRYQLIFDNISISKDGDKGGWEANVGAMLVSYEIEKIK